MSEMHDTSKLDDLIVTLIDSVKGYEHSAEKAEAARYRDFFLSIPDLALSPDEIARAILFIPSDAASFVTGQILTPTAG